MLKHRCLFRVLERVKVDFFALVLLCLENSTNVFCSRNKQRRRGVDRPPPEVEVLLQLAMPSVLCVGDSAQLRVSEGA